MKYNLLIETDNDTIFTELPEDIQYQISLLNTVWPATVTPGTQVVNPTKLMHCVIDTDVEDVETLLNSLIIAYDLSWAVVGLQTFDAVDPIMVDEEITGYQALSVVPIDTDIAFQYLPDRYAEHDENGNPVGGPLPKDVSWFHKYQGMADWVI